MKKIYLICLLMTVSLHSVEPMQETWYAAIVRVVCFHPRRIAWVAQQQEVSLVVAAWRHVQWLLR